DRGKVLNPSDTSDLLKLLETTVYNDRINYYLPGITIAHKVGMDGGVMNDAGVVFQPGRPFVISMFTYTSSGSTGIQAIRDVARVEAARVGDHDVVAMTGGAACGHRHDPVVRRQHRAPVGLDKVDPGVEVREAAEGRLEPERRRAEALRDLGRGLGPDEPVPG